MSTSSATIINPLISTNKSIKKECASEKDNCILFISNSRNSNPCASISTNSSDNNDEILTEDDDDSKNILNGHDDSPIVIEDSSLDIQNGHNYTATNSKTSNHHQHLHHLNHQHHHHHHHHQQSHQLNYHQNQRLDTSTQAVTNKISLNSQQQDRLNPSLSTITANRSSSATVKRIEFSLSKHPQTNSNQSQITNDHHHHHHHPTSITNNVDIFTANTNDNIRATSATLAATTTTVSLKSSSLSSSTTSSPSSSPSVLNFQTKNIQTSTNTASNHKNDGHSQEMFCSSTVSGDCSTNICLDSTNNIDCININKARDSSPKRLCLVCGDTASGFHYGVASCEACKAFFKRTIQGNIEYTCPATNNCEINKRRRKACQACRFQKCLRMGMLKEGVRLDRVRGGRQKYRRISEVPYQGANFLLKKSNLEDNRIVSALIKCEPEPIISNANVHLYSPSSTNGISSVSSSQYKNLCILSELVDKELVATIAWAKQIPGFTDLILNDQMRLLQSTWAEILSLSLAFRSQQYSSPPNTPACLSPSNASSTTNPIFNKLVFAADFILDDQQAAQCNADDLFTNLIQLIKRLNHIKIAKEEYLLMKAIILTNADIQLENPESVSKLRHTLIRALQDCVSIIRPQSAIDHLSQLFLCFPLLRQLDIVTRRLWLNILQEGSVPMQKLFVEMLESSVSF